MTTDVVAPAQPALTDRQERFIHEYLVDQNASAAALRAGYAPASARSQSVDLMANPAIRGRIRDELAALYSSVKLHAADLLRKRMQVAFFDPGKLVDARGNFLELHQLDEDTRAALLVHSDVRPSGERYLRMRQPQCNAALSALERRYAQFVEMCREREEPAAPAPAVEAGPIEVVRLTPPRRGREMEEEMVEAAAVVEVTQDVTRAEPVAREAQPLAPVARAAPAAPVAVQDTAPNLVQRAAGMVKKLVQGAEAAVPRAETIAQPAPPRPPSGPVRAPVPPRDKYWCDLSGHIDVDHPNIPPDVKARELEKRRLRQMREEERNHPPLRYVHSTVGLPDPPWPRDLRPDRPRHALNNADDPFGDA